MPPAATLEEAQKEDVRAALSIRLYLPSTLGHTLHSQQWHPYAIRHYFLFFKRDMNASIRDLAPQGGRLCGLLLQETGSRVA